MKGRQLETRITLPAVEVREAMQTYMRLKGIAEPRGKLVDVSEQQEYLSGSMGGGPVGTGGLILTWKTKEL